MIKAWPVIGSLTVARNRIFALKTLTAVSPRTTLPHDFYVLEAGDWVNVIPVTPTNEVVFVQQFRLGTQEVTLEIPGGLIDAGQSPAEAAARELLEETGYAGQLRPLGRVRPNPAFLNNWCYSFLAQDVFPAADRRLDDGEDLEIVRVPIKEIPNLIAAGRIDHALVLTAFLFYWQQHPAPGVRP